jgi:phosphatidylglycerol:prolipoprotein diacylglycerol transferase
MHPILFSISSLHIYSYGVMLALGVIAGTWLNCRLGRSNGISSERIQSCTFWIMIIALAGTRVFYVLLEPQEFAEQPWRALYIWEGGMVFYGGLAGGLLAAFILARRWKTPLLRLFDNLAPGLALGQALGRVGCFLAGCCYGIAWDGPGAVVFNNPNSLAPRHVHLFPAQLFEAGAMAIICLILLAFWKKRGEAAGRIICLYGSLAGVERLLAEQLRSDFRGAPIFTDFLTPTAIIALLMLIVCAWGFIFISRSKKRGGLKTS